MRFIALPPRSVSGWHLLLIALALGLLILFWPGRSAASEMSPSSDVLVPFFEVDLADSDLGLITLFSVCNDSPWTVDVQVTVHSNWGIPLLTIPLKLNGDEVRSFNLRDWLLRGDLPDRRLSPAELAHVQAALSGKPSPNDNHYYGTEVAPDLAVGYVILRTTGDRPNVLWGDYFQVEARRSFFQAETLVDIDPESCAPTTCKRHGVRFLDGGILADGTELLIWTERRWPPSPTPHPDWNTVNAEIEVYDEPGRHVEDRGLGFLPAETLKVGDLDLKLRFGWLEVLTDVPSFITQHLHTTGAPSASLHAWCLPEETAEPGPDIEIQKFVNGADADDPPGPSISMGDAVTWTFWVRNTGTVPLTDVEVTDSSGQPVTCHQTTLDPKETMECTLGGVAKACQQHNVGRVEATAPDFTEVSGEDHAWYLGEPHGSLGLEMSLNGFDASGPEGTWPQFNAGEYIDWRFKVINTGDVGLTQLLVSPGPYRVACLETTLQPGESTFCLAIVEAEPGQHRVEVTATAAMPCGTAATVRQVAYATYSVVVLEPAIDIEKLVNGQDADVPPGPDLRTGSTAQWKYVVINTGDAPLMGISVTDDRLGAVTCPKTALAVGESMQCEAEGTVVAGQYRNVGTAVGTPRSGPTVSANDAAHYYGRSPSISLQKLTNGQDADTPTGPSIPVGSAVLWTYVVTNTGDTALTAVAVTDDKGVAVTCPKTELSPGESMTCTASGTAVAGQYANVGTVTGKPTVGPDVTSTDPSHYFGYRPLLTLEKLVNRRRSNHFPPGGCETAGRASDSRRHFP